MSLTVDDDRRGRIRSRSLNRAAASNDAGIIRERSAAPILGTSSLLPTGSMIRGVSPFEAPPVIDDDIPVHFHDRQPRTYSNDGSQYEYEKRPASWYQIQSPTSPSGGGYRSSKEAVYMEGRVASPRSSASAFQTYPAGDASQYLVEEGRKRERSRERRSHRQEEDLAYGKLPGPERNAVAAVQAAAAAASASSSSPNLGQLGNPTYADSPSTYAYARFSSSKDTETTLSVKYGHVARDPSPSPTAASFLRNSQRASLYGQDPSASSPSVLTVEPPGARRERERSRQRSGTSPAPVGRMSSLSVSTPHHSANLSLSAAPPSPLQESYHGTWQQTSPLPSPLLLASQAPELMPQVIDALSPSDDERSPSRRNRRARFHDPQEIATRIATALKGTGMPDIDPLIEILPGLTHAQVMELRDEYKAIVKTGPERKGVNVAKHIRARLKDEDASLMKACYATALGRWEGDAYWANFWYQGDKTRRELVIEALMGRTNADVRMIKDSFADKKYDNSLTKCMRTELKEDKFKKAVLMVLDERRMEEFDRYGRRLPLDMKLVDQDVDDLYRAIKSEKGGESVMISIVITRSDSHLREVLKVYDRAYKSNFARDCLKKSSNLVGELMAHILNGVINKPVRDALLLHHALTASRKDPLRRELLISRLVRCHWDRQHFAQVRAEFADRYEISLQQAITESIKGPVADFLCELCIARVADDVRQVDRIPQ